MGIARVKEYRAFEKLEKKGIYIFINKSNKKFYVGKASNKIYDRVRNHVVGSHNERVYKLVNNSSCGLYIYPLEDFCGNNIFHSEDLEFIEYSVMNYLITQGYETINDKDSFSWKVRERYYNSEKIDLKNIIKFEQDLFCGKFKKFLVYELVVNDYDKDFMLALKNILQNNSEEIDSKIVIEFGQNLLCRECNNLGSDLSYIKILKVLQECKDKLKDQINKCKELEAIILELKK